MKAREFLNLAEQDTIQVLPPFDTETIKQEFGKKATEFEYSGIIVGDVKFTPEGTTLVLQQGNISSEVTFSYSDDVGPFAAVKTSSGESVNLDLTPMNPPVLDSSGLGKQIDMQNLTWLSKEGFEAISAAAQIKETPEEEVISGSPEQIGSDGSGAATPTSQQPQSPPVELDAKTVPAPRPQGQPSGEYPGESLEAVGQDVMLKCTDCGYTASEHEFLLDTEKEFTCPDCGSQYISDAEVEESKKKEAKTSDLPVPVQHQIKIAKKTLQMSDVGAMIMGGMTKQEATEILKKYGLLKGESFNRKALPGIRETAYLVTFRKDKDINTITIQANSETDALNKAKSKLRTDQRVISVGKPTDSSGKSMVKTEGKDVEVGQTYHYDDEFEGERLVDDLEVKEIQGSKVLAYSPKLRANIRVSKNRLVSESKELTYFRFIVREGKKIKIPVGTNSALIETKKKKAKQINKVVSAKPFKPGQYWHSQKESLVKKAKENADIKKDHLAKFGFTEVSTCNPVKKEGIYGYRVGNDDDGEMVNCPVCKGITGKASPNCPRCKGKGYVMEQLHEQQVTKKFFITMANFLKNMPEQISKKELVDELVRIFQSENPRFDSGRFRLASGA